MTSLKKIDKKEFDKEKKLFKKIMKKEDAKVSDAKIKITIKYIHPVTKKKLGEDDIWILERKDRKVYSNDEEIKMMKKKDLNEDQLELYENCKEIREKVALLKASITFANYTKIGDASIMEFFDEVIINLFDKNFTLDEDLDLVIKNFKVTNTKTDTEIQLATVGSDISIFMFKDEIKKLF